MLSNHPTTPDPPHAFSVVGSPDARESRVVGAPLSRPSSNSPLLTLPTRIVGLKTGRSPIPRTDNSKLVAYLANGGVADPPAGWIALWAIQCTEVHAACNVGRWRVAPGVVEGLTLHCFRPPPAGCADSPRHYMRRALRALLWAIHRIAHPAGARTTQSFARQTTGIPSGKNGHRSGAAAALTRR